MKPIYQKTAFSLLFLLSITACNRESNSNPNKIASIPEASGISYCQDTNTLIVADDEGLFYEITPNGKIISEYKLGKYDLEGVVCEKEILMFAVENKGLLEVNRKTLESKLLKLKGKNFKLTKKAGIEGLTKIKELYYLSIQSKKKEDSKLLVVKAGANYAKVINIINHGIIDSSGLTYENKKLYIVSDKKDSLYIYSLKQNKIKKKIKLPKFAQEGVAFGKNSNIFLADDDGAVMRYTLKELGL